MVSLSLSLHINNVYIRNYFGVIELYRRSARPWKRLKYVEKKKTFLYIFEISDDREYNGHSYFKERKGTILVFFFFLYKEPGRTIIVSSLFILCDRKVGRPRLRLVDP